MTGDAAVWNAWTRVTAVSVAPASRPRFVRVRLPIGIDPGPDGAYADLRVVDDRGTETPYALDPERARTPRRLRMTDTGFVPHRYTQAVLDFGEKPRADTVTLEVDTDSRPTYFERVAVDASDDRVTWRVIRNDAIIYRVADDGGRGNQTIAFPESNARWLRVRIADPQAAFPITGARVDDTAPSEPAAPAPPGLQSPGLQPLGLQPLALAAVESTDEPVHRQVWTFEDRGVALRPSAVTFSDGGKTFARHAVVESSEDGETWAQAADGYVTRFAQGGAQTSFAFGESSARRWRVAVENRDDAPVPGLRPTLLARPREVVFEAQPQRRYRLLSGNDAVDPPSYDLGARLAHSAWRAQPATADVTDRNAYAEPHPVTENVPGVLTAVLIAVAVGLGALALRTVRSAKSA